MNKQSVTTSGKVRKNKRNVVSQEQIEVLIDYMERHSLFARGQIPKLGPQGHIKYKNMWVDLTRKLNSIGPSIRTAEKWQEKWKNMRLNSKQRTAAYMNMYNKTGHTSPDIQLKEEDKRISDIFGKYGVGLNVRPESGFKYTPTKIEGNSDFNMCCAITAAVQYTFECNGNNNSEWQTKRAVKPTDEQKDVMLQFMMSHPQFAANPVDPALWDELLSLLNAFYPVRSLKAWQRTWADSIKAAKQAQNMFNSGMRGEPLSDFHMAINELFNEIENRDYIENSCSGGGNDTQMSVTLKRPSTNESSQLQKKKNIPYTATRETASQGAYLMQANFQPNMEGSSPQRTPLRNINTVAQPQSKYAFPSPSVPGTHTNSTMQVQRTVQVAHTNPNDQTRPNVQARPNVQGAHGNTNTQAQASVQGSLSDAHRPINFNNVQENVTGGTRGRGNLLMQLRQQVPVGGNPNFTASTSKIAETAAFKASYLMNAFKQSQKDIINQIVTCYEKQNAVLADGMRNVNETLKSLPTIMATHMENAVTKALQEFNSAASAETKNFTHSQELQNYDTVQSNEPIMFDSVADVNQTAQEEGTSAAEASQAIPQDVYNIPENFVFEDGIYLADGAYILPNNVERNTLMDLAYIVTNEEVVQQDSGDDEENED